MGFGVYFYTKWIEIPVNNNRLFYKYFHDFYYNFFLFIIINIYLLSTLNIIYSQ